jgi:hypothetical protein
MRNVGVLVTNVNILRILPSFIWHLKHRPIKSFGGANACILKNEHIGFDDEEILHNHEWYGCHSTTDLTCLWCWKSENCHSWTLQII